MISTVGLRHEAKLCATAVAPNRGRAKITDDQVLPAVPGKIYGYKQCVMMNKERNNLIGIIQGGTPLRRAECPMMLSKGKEWAFDFQGPLAIYRKLADFPCA